MSHHLPLILGSSSVARKLLLERLNLPFTTLFPDIDETPKQNETPTQLVNRLALEKAYAINQKMTQQGMAQNTKSNIPQTTIISADEVGVNLKFPMMTLGKPLTKENAFNNLMAMRQSTVHFITGLVVLVNQQEQIQVWQSTCKTVVKFRAFTAQEAQQIVDYDNVLHCAGAFRSEGMSISLCKKITEDEPGALIGLPLISLCDYLRQAGFLI